jgi:hypothetical protein
VCNDAQDVPRYFIYLTVRHGVRLPLVVSRSDTGRQGCGCRLEHIGDGAGSVRGVARVSPGVLGANSGGPVGQRVAADCG